MSNCNFEHFCGFTVFHKKTEKINWRNLAKVDIDRIIRDNDAKSLGDNLKSVAFCDIDVELDLRGSDKNLVKMFKLAQLMVDYLLTSQNYLLKELTAADEKCQADVEEIDNMKRKQMDSENFIHDLKRECHRRKKLILAQQQIMDSGSDTHHQCPYCEKAFLTGQYLRAHLEKRHQQQLRFQLTNIDLQNSGNRGSHHELTTSKYKEVHQHSGRKHDQENRHPNQYDERIVKLLERYERENNLLRSRNRELENNQPDGMQSGSSSLKRRSNFGDLIDDGSGNRRSYEKSDRKSPGLQTQQADEARRKALAVKNRQEQRPPFSSMKSVFPSGDKEAISLLPVANESSGQPPSAQQIYPPLTYSSAHIVSLSPYDTSSTYCFDDMDNELSVSVVPIEGHENCCSNDDKKNCDTEKVDGYSSILSTDAGLERISSVNNNKSNTADCFLQTTNSLSSMTDINVVHSTPKQLKQKAEPHNLAKDDSQHSLFKGSDQNLYPNYDDRSPSPNFPDNVENRLRRDRMRVTIFGDMNQLLQNHGIEPDSGGLSDERFRAIMKIFNHEQEQSVVKYSDDYKRIREKLVKEVEEEAKIRYEYKLSQRFGDSPDAGIRHSHRIGDSTDAGISGQSCDSKRASEKLHQKEILEKNVEQKLRDSFHDERN